MRQPWVTPMNFGPTEKHGKTTYDFSPLPPLRHSVACYLGSYPLSPDELEKTGSTIKATTRLEKGAIISHAVFEPRSRS